MARQLPFEVAPTQRYQEIGDEQRGILKLRQRGSVSIKERMALVEVDRSEELFKALADFSVKVHREAEEPSPLASAELHEVYLAAATVLDMLRAGGNPAMNRLEAELALNHTDELWAMHRDRVANSENLIVRQATIMIQNRLANCADWTDEDTKALDSEQLIVKIALFYREESNGGGNAAQTTADAVKQLEELKAALGKLRTEAGALQSSPTGEASTGAAETLTPAAESLNPTDSEISPSPTCSMPSTPQPSGKGKGFTEKS
jgi:hypothetical protein